MRWLLPLILFLSAGIAYGQSDLPEIGKISDIKGKTKVYVIVAEAEYKKSVIKALEHSPLIIVSSPKDADFFLDYHFTDRQSALFGLHTGVGQIDVYYYREKVKVQVWSKSYAGAGFRKDNPSVLVDKFLKDLKP